MAHQVLVGFHDTALAIRMDLLGLSPTMVLLTSSRAGGEGGPQKALWNQGSPAGHSPRLDTEVLAQPEVLQRLVPPQGWYERQQIGIKA